jgi:hypothetical protein
MMSKVDDASYYAGPMKYEPFALSLSKGCTGFDKACPELVEGLSPSGN